MEDRNMSTAAKKILDEVLLLPADARMNLVEQILASLNLPTQPEIDKLWAEEAERRIDELDKGTVQPIPGEKVFSDIRKKYRR
jgi:putative addiction module component (TIGR02574 family)